MKTRFRHGLTVVLLAFFCTLTGFFPAFASEPSGPADTIDDVTVSGLALDNENPDKAASVGDYLGRFETTAYCNCAQCCPGGHILTYSGTVPKANHTISADISIYPIGTKLMIGDIVYTVEDIGSNVNGNHLDIYFETHQQALNYGLKTVDVYLAE